MRLRLVYARSNGPRFKFRAEGPNALDELVARIPSHCLALESNQLNDPTASGLERRGCCVIVFSGAHELILGEMTSVENAGSKRFGARPSAREIGGSWVSLPVSL